MYSSEDIIWIKNVRRNNGEEWAYDYVNCGSTFLLNWPSSKPNSALRPNNGDIIVLFQKVNYINGKRNYDVYFTHLVSPVSDEIHQEIDNPRYQWCRKVKLIAKANPISAIPNPGYYDFTTPNSGLTNPINNLRNNINLTEFDTQEDIWRLFEDYFCHDIENELVGNQEPNNLFGEVEGDKIIKEHIKQEIRNRNSRIVQLAKKQALRRGNGKIKCECCNFDFYEFYGKIGYNFIECHHETHLSSGKRLTTPNDLTLVCSNCHRMLHRRKDDGNYHTIDTLRQLIDKG